MWLLIRENIHSTITHEKQENYARKIVTLPAPHPPKKVKGETKTMTRLVLYGKALSRNAFTNPSTSG